MDHERSKYETLTNKIKNIPVKLLLLEQEKRDKELKLLRERDFLIKEVK